MSIRPDRLSERTIAILRGVSFFAPHGVKMKELADHIDQDTKHIYSPVGNLVARSMLARKGNQYHLAAKGREALDAVGDNAPADGKPLSVRPIAEILTGAVPDGLWRQQPKRIKGAASLDDDLPPAIKTPKSKKPTSTGVSKQKAPETPVDERVLSSVADKERVAITDAGEVLLFDSLDQAPMLINANQARRMVAMFRKLPSDHALAMEA